MKFLKKMILAISKWIFIIMIITISIVPIIWIVMSSFKTNMEIMGNALSLPTQINFNGYVKALKISPIFNFYGNSIIISAIGTIANVFFVGMAAYVLARFKFKLKSAVMGMLSISLFLPMTALIQPVYMVVNNLGFTDTRTGLILVYAALGLPTTLFILRSFFMTISPSLEESAYIDGAGFLATYMKIILPMAIPGLATAAILQFLLCWNEFQFALVLTSKATVRTLPLALNYFASQFSYDHTAKFAAIVMVIIPSITFYVVLNEQIVSGLATGAVKE